jgi:hypothetical protein
MGRNTMTWWGWVLVAVFGWPAAALGLGLFLGRVFQLPTQPTARRIGTDHQHLTESNHQ